MDEEEDRDFSKSIVFGFLEQAEQTFGKMETEMYKPLLSASRPPLLSCIQDIMCKNCESADNLDFSPQKNREP